MIDKALLAKIRKCMALSNRTASAKRTDNDKWRGFTKGDGVELNIGVGGSAAPLAIS